MNSRLVLGNNPATRENFEKGVERLYGANAKAVLAEYAPATDEDVAKVATELASDRFIAYSTWKWIDAAAKADKPVYRYYFSRVRPGRQGAEHASEIDYAMGNLPLNKAFEWTPDDHKVSDFMRSYFVNFIKTGDPNGAGLPTWPKANAGGPVQFMHLDVEPRAETETHRGRYLLLDELDRKK
jgi:para-nitrobenzyl esterase